MMYACYEFVSNVEEKHIRLSRIKESFGNDPNFYSAYLEIPRKYNAPIRELKAIKALKAAIKKGKIQMVVIPSFDNFYMAEARTYSMLLNLMRSGICIAIENPDNVQTEQDLFEKCLDAQMECVITVLSIPVMSDCRIAWGGNTPFIRLEEDCTTADDALYPNRMPYADAVERFCDSGFFLYRSDVNSWYHVSSFMAERMLEIYDINKKIIRKNILLSL